MSSFTLNNTAADIDSAITRVVSADNTPTANSDNMVTSAGVKGAIDQLAASSTLTVNSFTPTALETSNDGLTATDDAIPTSKAVKDHVASEAKSMASWANASNLQYEFRRATASGTAASDGFLIASATGADSEEDGTIAITVAGRTFRAYYAVREYDTVTVPIRQGESYSVSVQESASIQILFRALN